MDGPATIDRYEPAVSRRTALRLGAGAVGIGLAGCLGRGSTGTSEWPTFARDARNTGATPVDGLTDPTERWNRETGFGVVASPAVSDGSVYVPDRGGLFAYDLETDEETATFDRFGGELHGTPSVVDGTIYVSMLGDGRLFAFDTDGTELWNTNTGPARNPTVVDGTVYVQSVEEGYLRTRALEAASGEEEWSVDHGRWSTVSWSPTVDDGTVYVTARDLAEAEDSRAFVAALDAETGDEQWRADEVDPLSAPAVDDGSLYVSVKDSIAAFDAKTGDLLWFESHAHGADNFVLPLNPPAIATETIYVGVGPRNRAQVEDEDDAGSAVIAVNRETGDEQWTFETDRLSATVSLGSDVVYANTIGGLYALDPADGDVRWEYNSPFGTPSDENLYASAPAIVDDAVVVGCPAGGVYVLEDD